MDRIITVRNDSVIPIIILSSTTASVPITYLKTFSFIVPIKTTIARYSA